MKSIQDVGSLKGKRVLVRCDFNVPIEGGIISDDYRIKKTLPTITFLRESGAKVILIAHLENEENDSLQPIFEYLKKLFFVSFVEDFTKPEALEVFANMKDGDVTLLQNIRHFSGEKKNDPDFSKQLASLGEIYVNEAFSVSHRAHASVVGVPMLLPHYAGLLLMSEIEHLSGAFHPDHPFLFILAGAKFSTKLPLVEKFLALADRVFIGGALANDLFKAKGLNVGASLVADTPLDLTHIVQNPKLILPSDVTLLDKRIVLADAVKDGEQILDAGPQTIIDLKKSIAEAKYILWNGTLGVCEKGFTEPTLTLAKAIAESRAETIVGGGDTVSAIQDLTEFTKFSFVSTGGGAMLDFLANETLPGIEALK